MAEDDANNMDLNRDNETVQSPKSTGQNQQKSQRNTRHQPRQQQKQNPKCRPRIDQLAIPNRRLILALYKEHAEHLPKGKVEKIKALLQELYAMTPEETERYFEDLRKKSEEHGRMKDIKFMFKRLLKKRKKNKQIKQAYAFVFNLLVRGIEFASKNQIPPLVTVRLRNLSNIILEQICDLRNVNIPNRDNHDQIGGFLIRVADWMAIAVEHLYYGVQLKKNKELEKIEKEVEAREKEKQQKPKDKSLKQVNDKETPEADDEQDQAEAVLSEPLLVSEIE